MFAGGQLGPRQVDYMSGRGVATIELGKDRVPITTQDLVERNIVNAKTKEFIDSTSVPLGENIHSSALQEKRRDALTPNIHKIRSGKITLDEDDQEAMNEHTQKYYNH